MKKANVRTSAVLLGAVCLVATALPFTAWAADPPVEMDGKQLAFDRQKGNCLACHDLPRVPGVELPGNVGPALVAIKDRFTRERLRQQIWDAAQLNVHTAMPPFGRNKILTESEIDKVTDFIFSL